MRPVAGAIALAAGLRWRLPQPKPATIAGRRSSRDRPASAGGLRRCYRSATRSLYSSSARPQHQRCHACPMLFEENRARAFARVREIRALGTIRRAILLFPVGYK